MHANRESADASGDVIAAQGALAAFVELSIAIRAQQMRWNRDAALKNLSNLLVHRRHATVKPTPSLELAIIIRIDSKRILNNLAGLPTFTANFRRYIRFIITLYFNSRFRW